MANLDEPIPGYRLIERLGRGGFGEVWKAEAPGGFHKAIKFVYGDLEALGEEGKPAEQELKALNRVKSVRHPFILSLERFDIVDGQLVIVMELADRNLWDRFRECREQGLSGIPRDELLRYIEESSEALDLMNTEHQLQHLDIKPQNLFLVHNHVKVADFGLAKAFEGMSATVTGGVTPVYAAPETFDDKVTRFSDQYSLAIVYMELLTGVRPFSGTNPRQLVLQHISGSPNLNPLPEHDRAIVSRALSKKPSDRFPLCCEFARSLRHATNSPSTTVSVPPVVPDDQLELQTPSSSKTYDRREAALAPPAKPPVNRRAPMPSQAPMPAPVPPMGRSLPALTTQGQVLSTRSLRAMMGQTNGVASATKTVAAESIKAPPEETGPGVLFPALLMSVGGIGLVGLQQFLVATHERFGPGRKLPHLHTLHLDTDPETVQEATSAPPPMALSMEDVLLARLNRPGHYLRRDGLPPVDKWLNNQVLYQMPRNPSTIGLRAFGRLALCDNFRLIMARLRQLLEKLTEMEPLREAERQTGLGIRTNRPRIYLVCSLTGGSGSGMFLDLAYIIRHALRQLGYTHPEVIGIFFLPPVDRFSPKAAPIINAHAALRELSHFSAPNTVYHTKFDTRLDPVIDRDRPFSRCVLIPLSKLEEPRKLRKAGDRAAGLLIQELLTPLGRTMEEVRTSGTRHSLRPNVECQSFGLFRLAWPRQRLLQASTRRFCIRMLQYWTADSVEHLREPLRLWLDEEWERRLLDPQTLITRLRDDATRLFEQPPEQYFAAMLEPLAAGVSARGGRYDARSACLVLDEMFHQLGRPETENDQAPGRLTDALGRSTRGMIKEAEAKITEMAMHFVEEPGHRVAGAEEIVRQITAQLKQIIESLEKMEEEIEDKVQDAYRRLMPLIGTIAHTNRGVTPELLEQLERFPVLRYREILVRTARSVYRSLLGNAQDYLRDIHFCRIRLNELTRSLRELAASDPCRVTRGIAEYILPPGCKTIEDAADQFLDSVALDEFNQFDTDLQVQIRRQFGSLTQVCLETNDHWIALRGLMEDKAVEFLNHRLERSNTAEVFFRKREQAAQDAQRTIINAYDEAVPSFLSPKAGIHPDFCLVSAPTGGDGEQFFSLVQDTLPDVEFTRTCAADEIVFYREMRHFKLNELPQLGPIAQDVYEKRLKQEDATPHSRMDVLWLPPS